MLCEIRFLEGAQGHFLSVDYHISVSEHLLIWTCFPRDNSSSHSLTFIIRGRRRRENREQDEVGGGGGGQTDMCFNKTTQKHEKKKEELASPNWISHTHITHPQENMHPHATNNKEEFLCANGWEHVGSLVYSNFNSATRWWSFCFISTVEASS